MKFEAKPYQTYCINRLIEQKEIGLFLDMGMGKTVITLTALNELIYERFEVGRCLVIAPLRPALETWPSEISKWDHLAYFRYSVAVGTKKERENAIRESSECLIINREQVCWLVDYFKDKWPFDTVVIDELSSFKSSKAQRFRALRKVRPYIKRIVGLTGTPAPNGLIDLWPQMYLLDQGKALGRTLTSYRSAYFDPDKRNATTIFSWKLKSKDAEQQIYRKIEKTCISMKSKDFLDLPEKIEVDHEIELPSAVLDLYKQMEKDMLLPFKDGDIDAGSAGILVGKLLQMTGGAVYNEYGESQYIHSTKMEVLDDLIEAANGQPILIFYGYRHERERLLERYKDAKDVREAGSIQKWNEKEISIMLAHPLSAGHGLNLQDGGHIIIWYSPTFGLESYLQANKRLHRMGQKEPVLIHRLVAKDTIDEYVINTVLANKEVNQNALIEAVKARLKEYEID